MDKTIVGSPRSLFKTILRRQIRVACFALHKLHSGTRQKSAYALGVGACCGVGSGRHPPIVLHTNQKFVHIDMAFAPPVHPSEVNQLQVDDTLSNEESSV